MSKNDLSTKLRIKNVPSFMTDIIMKLVKGKVFNEVKASFTKEIGKHASEIDKLISEKYPTEINFDSYEKTTFSLELTEPIRIRETHMEIPFLGQMSTSKLGDLNLPESNLKFADFRDLPPI